MLFLFGDILMFRSFEKLQKNEFKGKGEYFFENHFKMIQLGGTFGVGSLHVSFCDLLNNTGDDFFYFKTIESGNY